MKESKIIIRGAREHNLKNIDLDLPKNKLIVFSGVSGSGKSSLAFDTIFAEGQRRYLESLSSYARQFLNKVDKPDVDKIDGLSPSIAINQKSNHSNSRSTVGTITEIYDYMRILWARVGDQYCPECNHEIKSVGIDQIINSVFKLPENSKIIIAAVIAINRKGEFKNIFEQAIKDGYTKAIIDNEIVDLNEDLSLDKNKKHSVDIVIDRVILNEKDKIRITSSCEVALSFNLGTLKIYDISTKESKVFSCTSSCSNCSYSARKVEPRLFSFNLPYGACPECHGIGISKQVNYDKLFNFNKSIKEGALNGYKEIADDYTSIIKLLKQEKSFDNDTKLKDIKSEFLKVLKEGGRYFPGFDKIISDIKNALRSQIYKYWKMQKLESYLVQRACPTCNSKRLNKDALAVKINNLSIMDVNALNIEKALEFFKEIKLSEKQSIIAELPLSEIQKRLNFLKKVGLGYLTLDRESATLSGGESQRIRLASQIGSALTGVLYVLDEPSIGLHQRDNDMLLSTLFDLRDLSNTVIVVEHDYDTLLAADYLVDFGPRAGIHGGKIVAKGSVDEVKNTQGSLTADYLNKKLRITSDNFLPKMDKFIQIKGAKKNNIDNINVKIPLSAITVISGVSGSGKSTLLNEIIKPACSKIETDTYKSFKTDINITNVIEIDQSPIGRTPRSNPGTYIKVFDDIRILFSQQRESRAKGYKPGRFSFNVDGGRCHACKGDGVQTISMGFLSDVQVKCEVCSGKRYNSETLSVTFRDKNIYEVLNLSVDEAIIFFEGQSKILKKLKTMQDVGLGYVKIGQSALELSGGEAQRVKLAAELKKVATGQTLYIIDEPTTGLHPYDIKKLVSVLQKLRSLGNTIIIVEHNLDVIKIADHIIDLGPGGGDKGGKIIAQGSVDQVIKVKESYTGQYLKKFLDEKTI